MKKTSLVVLGAALILLAARFGISAFSEPNIPDSDQIRTLFETGKQAYEQKDVNTLMTLVSDDFNNNGIDASRLRLQLGQFFKYTKNLKVTYQPPNIRIEGDRAYAQTTASIGWEDNGWQQQDLGVIELELRKETERTWLVVPSSKWRVINVRGMNMSLLGGEF